MQSSETFRQTNLLYYALLAGQLIFFAIVYFVVLDRSMQQSGWPPAPFGIVIPLLLVAIFPVISSINNRQLSQGAEQADLEAKTTHYRNLVIVRSAFIEGANLFALIALLLENNTTYLFFFAAGLLLFFYFRPSADEFSTHYQLSGAEKAELGL